MFYITAIGRRINSRRHIVERCRSLVDVLNSPFFKYASNSDTPCLYELHRGNWKYEGLLNNVEFRQEIVDAVAEGCATL